ncbi:TlpA family protein disulfide reductase [Luteimonas gilva]|uniref:TlpA family protein disulfide reductase n=1 Tax=Luteimonas gilva TaxID=2572684 RepID=A0A4U5JVY8_9GAMM|nr:TlpA disulfide reductase family protein [Luteimonas gilva]TKR33785.1 TlpA family protein disulfide reductase [Luteimonas gilva]
MNRAIWLPMALMVLGCAQSDKTPESETKQGASPSTPVASASTGAPNNTVSSDGEGGNAEQEFREAMALSAYPKVDYRDEEGNGISFEEFMKQTSNGKTFGMFKNSKTKEAIVSLNKPGKPVAEETKSDIRIGSPLPALKNAKTLDGKALDDAMFSGRHTLVSFYYSECVPCIAEVPALNAYAKAHPEMGILAVTFDEAKEARAFVGKHGFEWPVLADSEAYIHQAGVRTYPTILLIGPDRKIVAKMKTTLLQREDDTASAVAALDRWVESLL